MHEVYWPKGFTYSPVSVCHEVHPSFLEQVFFTGNPEDADRTVLCIENRCVHSALRIKKVVKPHPLAGKEVFEGHPQHGVFAMKPIPQDTELGEYVGEIQFSDTNLGHGGVYCWHFSVNGFAVSVNSRRLANELSFINDFRGIGEAPNVETAWIVHRGRYYFGYKTIREVARGEELLVDYGITWEKKITG